MKQHFQVHSVLHSNGAVLRSTEVTEAWMKKAAGDFHFLNDPAEKTTHMDMNVLHISSGVSTNQTFLI